MVDILVARPDLLIRDIKQKIQPTVRILLLCPLFRKYKALWPGLEDNTGLSGAVAQPSDTDTKALTARDHHGCASFIPITKT